MLIPVLVATIITLGIVVFYLYFLAPRFNSDLKAEQLVNEKRYDEAIIEYRKTLEKYPLDSALNYKIATLLLQVDRIDEALSYLEKVIEINVYNAEVQKIDVLKLLATLYMKKDDKEKVFEAYYYLLQDYPSDPEALYHTGFLALGQELFDFAFKQLSNYCKIDSKRFDAFFGAGIAALQGQRLSEAIDHLKQSLLLKNHSDIGNIAMAFALYRKRDYKTAVNYANIIVENSRDDNAILIAKRILGTIFIELKKTPMATKLFEELKQLTIEKEWSDEQKVILYDLGFIYLLDDKTDQAYETWNSLYQLDRGYRNVQDLITRLRKEMDIKLSSSFDTSASVLNDIAEWKENLFPADFVWRICGLRSREHHDLNLIISKINNMSSPVGSAGSVEKKSEKSDLMSNSGFQDGGDGFQKLYKLDVETFRSMAYRITEKLDLVIDEILNTYRDTDGVDFMAKSKDGKKKVLVWFRRWEGSTLGEIPLRNFAQEINDSKASSGYFITTASLSSAGQSALDNLGKVSVVGPEELARLMKGVM